MTTTGERRAAAPSYRFRSGWLVRGVTVPEVYDVLRDVAGYPDWWRSVRAVGRLADDAALVACRSRVPKTLHLVLRPVVEDRDGGVLEATLEGDLVGVSRFELRTEGPGVAVDYRQQVDTPGVLLRLAGRVARPLLVWNHEQMMRALQEDLAARLSASGR
jgi:hypothetical protein